jgi:toxin ParE1/3/4
MPALTARYYLSNVAKEDLIRIHRYGVETFGTEEADHYLDQFFDQFEKIAQRPMSYQGVPHIKKGYRRCVCGVDSIYYRINNAAVEIMAIVGRQDLIHQT